MTSLNIFSAQFVRHVCSWNNLHEANFNWVTETQSHGLQKWIRPTLLLHQTQGKSNSKKNVKIFSCFVVLNTYSLSLSTSKLIFFLFFFLLQQYFHYTIHRYASCPINLLWSGTSLHPSTSSWGEGEGEGHVLIFSLLWPVKGPNETTWNWTLGVV